MLPPFAGRCQTRAMELPQHWVTADGFSPHLGQGGGTLTVWGWSSEPRRMPRASPTQRLAEALERVAREGGLPAGHGYYPRVPLREPVLEEVEAASGALLGVVTRNRMGCEVLCTDLLFIADVDVPELEDATASRRRVGDDRRRGEHRVGDRVESSPGWPGGRGRVPAPAAVGGPGAHPDDAGRTSTGVRGAVGCRARRRTAARRDERGREPGVRAGVGVRPAAPGPRGAGVPHGRGAAGAS